jgi:hypothetical protein
MNAESRRPTGSEPVGQDKEMLNTSKTLPRQYIKSHDLQALKNIANEYPDSMVSVIAIGLHDRLMLDAERKVASCKN